MRAEQPQTKRAVNRQLSFSVEEEAEEEMEAEEVISLSAEEEEEAVVTKPQAKPKAKPQEKPKMAKPPPAKQAEPAEEAKGEAKPKAAPKEISYEEVSDLLESLGFLFKARHLKSMARHYKALYARLLELVKPRLKFTSHATPVGRLIYFVPSNEPPSDNGWAGNGEGYYASGEFVTVCQNEAVVILPQYDSAKAVKLAELCKNHLTGESLPPLSKNHDEQLYLLIKQGFIETDVPQLESKMSECVYICETTKKAYWLNTLDGKKALGPIVNAQNIKKLTQDALDKEFPKLETLRDDLLALFGEYADAVAADEAAGKNKRKADDEEEEAAPPVEKKQRTDAGAKKVPKTPAPVTAAKPATPSKKDDGGKMEVERSVKSTAAKPKATTAPPTTPPPPSKKPAAPQAPQKKKLQTQPTKVTTVTTVQIGDMPPELRDRIARMASGEIRTMLSKVGDQCSSTDSALHEVEWYKKYL